MESEVESNPNRISQEAFAKEFLPSISVDCAIFGYGENEVESIGSS